MKTVSLLKDNFFTDGKYYYEGEWHYDGFGNRYPFLNTFKAKKLDKTQIEKIMGIKIKIVERENCKKIMLLTNRR